MHGKIRWRQRSLSALRPFDQENAARLLQVAHPERLDLLRIAQPIQIEMVDTSSGELVRLDERVRRAARMPVVTERVEDRPDERRLSCTELAAKLDDETRFDRRESLCERVPDCAHRLDSGRFDD